MIDLDISQVKPEEEKGAEELSVELESNQSDEVPIDENQSEADTEALISTFEIVDEVKEQPTSVELVSESSEEEFTIPPIHIEDEKPLSEEEIKTLAEIVDKEALEVLVSTTAENIQFLSATANTLQGKAASALRNYMKAFASAMPLGEEDKEYTSKAQQVAEIEHKAQECIDAAKEGELSLLAEMESLQKLINTVRDSGESPITDEAEKSIDVCKESLNKAIGEINEAQKDFDFLLEFEKSTREAPSMLQSELKVFARDLCDLLEKKELDVSKLAHHQAILVLALKRKQLFENEIQEAKEMNVKEVEDLLEKQKAELQRLSEEKLSIELRRLENEKDMERELQLKSAEDNYEKEMLCQLKRQASAHNEHLVEELTEQAKVLNNQHLKDLETKLDEQHKIYYRELEKKVKVISGIQAKITDVVNVESRQRHAQELWIAAQALSGTLDVCTLNGRTRSLMPEMISILQLGDRNSSLAEIVDSFPEQAALFGVIPEKDLINRFKKVKDVCKKVAAVSDGDSLSMYLLSYIKSIFVFSRWYLTDVDEPVDVNELTSYEILAKAEYFIQQGDLETAAKLMSQLKGVARKLCGDWLNEVRLLLETKQTAILLQAYAASLTAGLE